MKIIVSGKGGSGKSTLCVLMARALASKGYDILLVDADESNFGLQRLLGVSAPVHLMDHFGGKLHFKKNWMGAASEGLFKNHTKIEEIPEACIARADGIRLLVIGKIHVHGEGCACPMGVLSKSVLSKLDVGEKQIVIVDTEAGVEHFGRRVDGECDLILGIVDPSFESFMLAKKMRSMADNAGCDIFFILNKVTPNVQSAMTAHVDAQHIVAGISNSDTIFMESLEGKALSSNVSEIEPICRLITDRKQSLRKKPALFMC
jgi:CO dehydrogenase maturation factor